jgi:uncharacterized protein YbjT (DUF2867 family)
MKARRRNAAHGCGVKAARRRDAAARHAEENGMDTRSVATVFGGSGFIGRYVVRRLAQRGFTVRVAVRDTNAASFLRPAGRVGQVVPLFASLTRPDTVARVVDGADVVVNLVGILAERRAGDFDRIQGEGPGRIAQAAASAGVRQMVHVSAIGADGSSPSAYARSKAAGEAGVRAAQPGAAILRPSVVFGMEDKFFNLFGKLAILLPFMPVISGATRFQPVYVGDVADAVMAALERPDAAGRLFELGGPQVWTMRELMAWVVRTTDRRKRLVNLPMGLVRLQARVAELLPGKPLTRDQVILLQRDNVVADGMPGLRELGITPTPVDLVVPDYLARYGPGGGRRDQPGEENR